MRCEGSGWGGDAEGTLKGSFAPQGVLVLGSGRVSWHRPGKFHPKFCPNMCCFVYKFGGHRSPENTPYALDVLRLEVMETKGEDRQ